MASEPTSHLEFCYHILKQLLGLRAAGLFEVISNPNLHHNGSEVPADAWGEASTGTVLGKGSVLHRILS